MKKKNIFIILVILIILAFVAYIVINFFSFKEEPYIEQSPRWCCFAEMLTQNDDSNFVAIDEGFHKDTMDSSPTYLKRVFVYMNNPGITKFNVAIEGLKIGINEKTDNIYIKWESELGELLNGEYIKTIDGEESTFWNRYYENCSLSLVEVLSNPSYSFPETHIAYIPPEGFFENDEHDYLTLTYGWKDGSLKKFVLEIIPTPVNPLEDSS